MGLYQGTTPMSLYGKSAYQQALIGGFQGSEQEFNTMLASVQNKAPSIHASQHAPGGSDPVTPEAIGACKMISATIPKGRTKGDVDGDGLVTMADYVMALAESTGKGPGDEIGRWCANVDGDEYITSTDAIGIMQFAKGNPNSYLTKNPTFEDYYGNWTYVKVDDYGGYWTADISVDGLSTQYDIVIGINGSFYDGMFYQADVMSRMFRLYTSRPPIDDTPCAVLMTPGTGKAVICKNALPHHAAYHATDGIDPISPDSIGAVVTYRCTIPKGRAKGDVDGDGRVTMNDHQTVMNHSVGVSITDAVDLWCAKINDDDSININDAAAISNYVIGNGSILTSTPTFSDYYNNWTYVKVDDKSGYWTRDISVDEIIYDEDGGQFNMDALVTMEGTWERDMFYQAELINSGVRLYSKWPPIDTCYCYVSFWPGTGHCEIVANRVSETFIATLGVTTADEIEVAYRCGKAIYLNYDSTLYPLIGVPDNRNFAFQLPMQHGIVSILCTKNGWGSDIERYAHQYVEVSLPASGWDTDAKTQTVTVDGVSNTETDQMITPVPAVASQSTYYDSGIMCTAQARNSLTFSATFIPSEDLTVYIVIEEVVS